jgi:putative acetyltransferase
MTRVLTAIRIDEVKGDDRVAAIRGLFREYTNALGVDVESQDFAAELAGLPAPYVPPGGAIFLAYAGTRIAGCAALKRIGDGLWAIKPLFVRPRYRGKGIGRRLIEAVRQKANDSGCRDLRLDTPSTTASATSVRCMRLGFVEASLYRQNCPPGTHLCASTLSRDLLTRSSGDTDFRLRYKAMKSRWMDGPHSGCIAYDRVRDCDVVFHAPYVRNAGDSGWLQEQTLEAFDRHIHGGGNTGQLFTLPIYDHGVVEDGRPYFTEPHETNRLAHVPPYPDMYRGFHEFMNSLARLEARLNATPYQPELSLEPPEDDAMTVYASGSTEVLRVLDGGTHLWCRFADALCLYDEQRPGLLRLGRMRDLAACGVGLPTFIRQFVGGGYALKIDIAR